MKLEKNWKKKFRFPKKKFVSETYSEIGHWFRFLIPKPGFSRTLGNMQQNYLKRRPRSKLSEKTRLIRISNVFQLHFYCLQ